MTLEIAALGLTHSVEGAKDLVPGSGGVHHQQIGADAAIQKPGARRVAPAQWVALTTLMA